jgi:hypothetical protein
VRHLLSFARQAAPARPAPRAPPPPARPCRSVPSRLTQCRFSAQCTRLPTAPHRRADAPPPGGHGSAHTARPGRCSVTSSQARDGHHPCRPRPSSRPGPPARHSAQCRGGHLSWRWRRASERPAGSRNAPARSAGPSSTAPGISSRSASPGPRRVSARRSGIPARSLRSAFGCLTAHARGRGRYVLRAGLWPVLTRSQKYPLPPDPLPQTRKRPTPGKSAKNRRAPQKRTGPRRGAARAARGAPRHNVVPLQSPVLLRARTHEWIHDPAEMRKALRNPVFELKVSRRTQKPRHANSLRALHTSPRR